MSERGVFLPVSVACCFLLDALTGSARPADPPAGPEGAAVVSLRVVPRQVTLRGARAAQRFVVLGTFTDGLERDVTRQSRFSVSAPRLAGLDPAGRIVARADGELE